MSNRYFEFENGVTILYGKNSLIELLPKELKFLNAKRILLISGPVLTKIGTVDKVMSACSASGINICAIFNQTPNDSSLEIVAKIAEIYKENVCDSILAVGGGSVMDTAKGVKLLLSQNGNNLADYMGLNMVTKGERIPFVVLPTTSGTGSELTKVTVITDTAKETKLEFISSEILPDACILDPQLTTTLPPKATLLSAFDTLTHAIEAYTCTQKNLISDEFARLAIKEFKANLLGALEKPEDLGFRLGMMKSSAYAGLAFSNSMVGAVHAIGHALGGECHIGHDIAMSLLLPHVMEFNMDKVGKLYGELLIYFVDSETYKNTSNEQKGKVFVESVKEYYTQLAEKVGAAKTLSALGIKRAQFPSIIKKAMHDGAMLANEKALSEGDVLNILERVF